MPIKPGDNVATLAGRSLTFEIMGRGIRQTLAQHSDNADWQILSLSAEDLAGVRTGDQFALYETTGGTSVVLWEGVIKRRGQ